MFCPFEPLCILRVLRTKETALIDLCWRADWHDSSLQAAFMKSVYFETWPIIRHSRWSFHSPGNRVSNIQSDSCPFYVTLSLSFTIILFLDKHFYNDIWICHLKANIYGSTDGPLLSQDSPILVDLFSFPVTSKLVLMYVNRQWSLLYSTRDLTVQLCLIRFTHPYFVRTLRTLVSSTSFWTTRPRIGFGELFPALMFSWMSVLSGKKKIPYLRTELLRRHTNTFIFLICIYTYFVPILEYKVRWYT